MYIPSHSEQTNRETLFEVIREFSFATVVTHDGQAPFASHVPIVLDDAAETPRLLGHIARANPQWKQFGDDDVLVIFEGPHAYVSPSWYESEQAVPTWNYVAVHAYGRARIIDGDELTNLVDRTVANYESGRATPWKNELPEDFRAGLLEAIVGFEIPIDRLEGKFKLGQSRPEADARGAISGLRESGDGQLADWMERQLEERE